MSEEMIREKHGWLPCQFENQILNRQLELIEAIEAGDAPTQPSAIRSSRGLRLERQKSSDIIVCVA